MTLGGASVGLAAAQTGERMDPTWPPVLVALVVVLLVGAVVVVTMMFRRLRAAARGGRSGVDGRWR